MPRLQPSGAMTSHVHVCDWPTADCSGPLPAYFNELTALTTLNLDLSGLSNGPTQNSRGENLPEFLQFDR